MNPADVFKRKNSVLYAQNGNGFSPNNGSNIIRLQIGNNNVVMKKNSLRLNADLQVHDVNGNSIPIGQDTKFNNWSGVESCIENVTVYSLKHNSLLQNKKQYGRQAAKHTGVLEAPIKIQAGLWNESLNSLTYENTRIAAQTDTSVSIPIYVGCLDICEQYTMADVGGLVVEIQLSSSPQFIFDEDSVTTNTYTLSNVKFSAVFFEPKPEWFLKYEESKNNGVLLLPFEAVDSRLNQLQSAQDSISDVLNFRKLKAVSFTMLLATNQNNMGADSFAQESKDYREMSMSVNGVRHPYKFAITGDSNTNKAMFARSYLESCSMSGSPEFDGVLTNLDPTNYADTSAEVPLSGLGYLLSEYGMPMRNGNINITLQSDIANQTIAFMEYPHQKTLIISPQLVTVSS